jgi:hypothetical protein
LCKKKGKFYYTNICESHTFQVCLARKKIPKSVNKLCRDKLQFRLIEDQYFYLSFHLNWRHENGFRPQRYIFFANLIKWKCNWSRKWERNFIASHVTNTHPGIISFSSLYFQFSLQLFFLLSNYSLTHHFVLNLDEYDDENFRECLEMESNESEEAKNEI